MGSSRPPQVVRSFLGSRVVRGSGCLVMGVVREVDVVERGQGF